MLRNDSEVVRLGPFQHHIDSFLDHLQTSGYVPDSVAVKKSILMAFARWSQGERMGSGDLSEEQLVAFVKRRPPRYTSAVETSALAKSDPVVLASSDPHRERDLKRNRGERLGIIRAAGVPGVKLA